ncbi:MAG: hypothetical protein NTW60_02645 [Candidatus Wolfebacteria bacterium]|nr:hypothetical protein [Candidatus Wolfebacteria bacterium]
MSKREEVQKLVDAYKLGNEAAKDQTVSGSIGHLGDMVGMDADEEEAYKEGLESVTGIQL